MSKDCGEITIWLNGVGKTYRYGRDPEYPMIEAEYSQAIAIQKRQNKRTALRNFWRSKKGMALKMRLHANRDSKGRFAKK
jgi:hypothetical protein